MAAKKEEKILGIVYAYDCDGSDYDKVRGLGLKWIRLGICFPWKDQMHGTLCTEYLEAKEKFRHAKEHGFVMPSTPGLGSYRYDEKEGRTRWHDSFPAFVGRKRNLRNFIAMFRKPPDLYVRIWEIWQGIYGNV